MIDRPLESTQTLLLALKGGDLGARERLMERCLPLLRRWAHGRLPRHGRALSETDDIVQVSLVRALNQLERFESRRPGALLAYLRRILLNAVREELRLTARRPCAGEGIEELADQTPGVVEQAIGQETLDEYESALEHLTEKQRNAVILRLEFDMTYREIAVELELDSPDAARMLVVRGMAELARRMK